MVLPNRWAGEAFLKSYADIFSAIYDSTHTDLGPVLVADYDDVEVASFQYEFFALEADPSAVVEAIRNYPMRPGDTYVLNTAHAEEIPDTVTNQYPSLGYEYSNNYLLAGIELPAPLKVPEIPVHEVTRTAQAMFVNETHLQYEPMPAHLVSEPHIRQFYAELDGQAVGWIQLINTVPEIVYINNLYTLPAYRRRGVAGALLNRVHLECAALGIKWIILIPSVMALSFYGRHGYQPLLYFTVWRPADESFA